ncbi:hypothetical protein HYU92_02940 [Candidatus Curtissbacteria bacterium]|nr:hypothetical protein [Candidatus Curtissbacteria bacterium]
MTAEHFKDTINYDTVRLKNIDAVYENSAAIAPERTILIATGIDGETDYQFERLARTHEEAQEYIQSQNESGTRIIGRPADPLAAEVWKTIRYYDFGVGIWKQIETLERMDQ